MNWENCKVAVKMTSNDQAIITGFETTMKWR